MMFSINWCIRNEVIRFVEAVGSTSSRLVSPVGTGTLFPGKSNYGSHMYSL